MSFLKKIGQVVLKIIGLATGLLPLVSNQFPGAGAAAGVVSELGAIGKVIVTVEQLFTSAFGPDAKKGSDKLKAAVPQVAALIQASELMLHKSVKNEAAFEAAVTAITGGFADLLNSLGD